MKQACSFKDAFASFANRKAKIFGLSNDDPAKNKAFKEKYSYPFDLLCDVDTKYTAALGLYGEQEWKGKKYEGLGRATLIIDPDGRLTSVIKGVPPQDHAALSLKGLG